MYKNKLLKTTIFATVLTCLIALTACGGAKVPKKYEYDDLSKYIKLGKCKGIEYDRIQPSVSDTEVQEAINTALTQATKKKEVKEGTAASDSVVNIDYIGKINGKEFDGGKAQGYELNLAESNFISGFAEQVVGHKVGETFDIKVTFPSDYSNNKELAGKDAVFTIKLNSLIENVTPEYNDEFVKKNTKFKTTKEYEKNLKKQLLADKKNQASSTERQQVFQQILAKSEVKKYPKKELDDTQKMMIKTYKDLAKKNDASYEKYLKSNLGVDKKSFEEQTKVAAKNSVKQELVLYALAKKYGVEISDKDYNEYLDKLLKNAGYTRSEYQKASGIKIEEYAEQNNLFSTMLYEKVMDKVIKDSVAK